MPRYSEEIIQEVIEANDIVSVISSYVQLKKSGRSFMGRCPFHNERTPSFSVSPDKQLYHCFGCGAGGNVISFIMDIENMSFPEALEWLAERANITLPQKTEYTDYQYQQKKKFYEINRQLANYYYVLLKHSPKGQKYIQERGLDQSTIKTFGIGYSKDSWDNAIRFLSSNHVSSKEMLQIGLAIQGKNGKLYDRFRDRLMIPIQNSRDKIIGFGGRVIDKKENTPKYLNSPESTIFSKGTELFNLNRAKKNIQNNQFIVVEGYMDVIALYQYGIKNVVAALGTAFTPNHAKILDRYVSSVVLCFDGDQAGEKATKRAIDILKKSDLTIKVLRLNIEDDPDSFIRKNGTDAFLDKVNHAKTATDYLLDDLKINNPLNTNEERINYVNGAIPILQDTKSDVEKEVYAKVVSKRTGISAKMIFNEAKKSKSENNKINLTALSQKQSSSDKVPKVLQQAEKNVILGLLNKEINIENCKLDTLCFTDPFNKKIYNLIENNRNMTAPTIMSFLETDEKQQLSEMLIKNEQGNSDLLNMYEESIKILQREGQNKKIAQLEKKLKDDPFNSDVVNIMEQIKTLKAESNIGGQNGEN